MKTGLRMVMVLMMIFQGALVFAGGSQEDPVAEVSGRQVEVEPGWGFSWEFQDEEIIFTMAAPTTGWVGIGFNPSRMMRDASYVLAYVDNNGEVQIREDCGTGNTTHASDISLGGTQDVRVLSGSQVNGQTEVTFVLPLDSGDEYDVVFTPGETYAVLLAYGPDGSNNFTSRHRSRTTLEVQLIP